MKKTKEKLTFHIITSKIFSVGAPMVISEILGRKHSIFIFDEKNLPENNIILKCDVLIDMSTITSEEFYRVLNKDILKLKKEGVSVPLVVDPPIAVIKSLNKQMTHELFKELVPESYVLTGLDNKEKIEKFKNDKFVVVKPLQGWWGEGVEKLSLQEALRKHIKSEGLIIQRHIPSDLGVGRIVTLCYKEDFEIAASYLRISKSWKVAVNTDYKCIRHEVTGGLRDFAKSVSVRSGLYLNGIDYIYYKGRYILLETNAVPAMKEPLEAFGINIPKKLLNHIERNIRR